MKVKTISRSEEAETRSSTRDAVKQHKNSDPKLHPFEKAKELVRAVAAAKLERMFAKPFIGALSDHTDGVYCTATSPTSLVAFVSGSADGEAIVWDLAAQRKLWSVFAHAGFIRGLAVANDGASFFSCGDDRTIKQWRMAAQEEHAANGDGSVLRGKRLRGTDAAAVRAVEPLCVWGGRRAYTYIDHDWRQPRFATSSTVVDVWDPSRSEPLHTYEWGAETVTTVRFNPAEVRRSRVLLGMCC